MDAQAEVVYPADKTHWLELRHKNINSTEVSCLFGCNPYMTEFELWHNKQMEESPTIDDTETMAWGRALEAAIAEETARLNNWKIYPKKEYIFWKDAKIGSSFDFYIYEMHKKPILLEIKKVSEYAFSKNWIENDEGTIEAPPHIELQVQHQMMLTDSVESYIAVLVGGITLKLLHRKQNTTIMHLIQEKCEVFWKSIDSKTAPKINYEKDSEFITRLYSHAEPNKVLDAKEDATLSGLVNSYNDISEKIKDLVTQKDAFKAQILQHIDDAEKVIGPSWSISAGITPEVQMAFTRKSFRNFKISKRGQKNV